MFKKYVSVKLVSIRNSQENFNGYELKLVMHQCSDFASVYMQLKQYS